MSKELSYELISNYLISFLNLRFKKSLKLNPLFFTYYLTLNCNFNCQYCDFGYKRKIKDTNKPLNTGDTIRVLEIIKKECSYIYLTGGEPLLRNDIVDILKACKELGYKSIAINTNMSLMHKRMEILDYITDLVASFDVLDEKEYSGVLGVSSSTVKQVKKNIVNCVRYQKEKNFVLTVNCVITPETIDHAQEVINFCNNENIRFTVVPGELDGGEIDDKLKDNEEYQRLIKDIINAKKHRKNVLNSHNYLTTIKIFKQFRCYPTLTPHIYPDGSLLYPCQPQKKGAVNLLETGSYKKALDVAIQKFGPVPECGNRCYKACYVEPSNFMKNPIDLLRFT